MARIEQLPPDLDLKLIAGRPFTLTVTCTGATITSPSVTMKTTGGDAYTTDPGVPTVSVASSVITVAFSAADTSALNATTRGKSYLWALSATVDGDGPFDLLAGVISALPVGTSGSSSSTSSTLTFTAGVTAVALTVSLGAGSGGDVATHIADTSGAHAASAISYAGGTGMSATDVEAAIDELATEKANTASLGNLATASTINEYFCIACSDETTAITTGTKATFRMPFALTVTAVRATLTTASSSGTPTVDINDGGTTILSTKLTIDANEKTSTTAATPAVISDTALADDAEITIDVDVAGTGAAGLKVWIIGTRAV